MKRNAGPPLLIDEYDFDLQLFAHPHHGGHDGGGGGHHGGGSGGGAAVAAPDGRIRASFAEGTSEYPTPIQGLGSALTSATNGGNVTPLTPIPKTGFVGQLNHLIAGTLTVGTAGTAYQVPLHRIFANYTFQNSLAFPYRNLNGDDVWFWANIGGEYTGPFDPVYNSATMLQPAVTSTGSKNYQWGFTDWISLNDGLNFSKYVLSALTNSNDLTILITWLQVANIATLQQNTTVFSAYTASDAVSCVYHTVPDPDEWYWPDTSKVQQCIGDPSFNTPQVGQNNINLTPISGPDFLGLGIQVLSSGGTVDPLTPAGSGISQIAILVGGNIPLKTYTLADLIRLYENRFGRSPSYGYLYIDMCSDLGIPNSMSNVMRKALATTKYAQITVQVTLNANFTAGAGAKINLFKRTQQKYAGNAAIS